MFRGIELKRARVSAHAPRRSDSASWRHPRLHGVAGASSPALDAWCRREKVALVASAIAGLRVEDTTDSSGDGRD